MVILTLVIVGLCLGSFVNALVWRLQQQGLPKSKQAAKPQDLSIVKGRSMCTHCHHTLGILDLLPLVSWLGLRGRCRYCHQPIGWQYPLVEASLAALFVASYAFWPFDFDAKGIFLLVVWLAALVALLALLVYDLRWMLLPNKIVFPLIGLALLQVVVVSVAFDGGLGSLLQAGYGLLIAGGIFYVLFQVSRGSWIGGGDVKLGFALGLLLGNAASALLLLFTASVLGTLLALPGLLTKKLSRTSRIPFGPFLIVAAIIVMLFGRGLIDWYTQTVLYM